MDLLSKEILGVRIDIVNYDDTLNFLGKSLQEKSKLTIVSPLNLECIMKARKNKDFKNFLNNTSNLNTIDGIGIVNALKLYKIKFGKRVCGSDLVSDLADICSKNKKRYFILGASEDVSAQAKEVLIQRHSELVIDNYSPTFSENIEFSEEENDKIKKLLFEFKPDCLCVAFGAVKQELWIKKNVDFLESIGVKIVIGVGGSFDFISGKIKRAPDWYQNHGMEWVYRFLQEPKARFKRQISTIPLYYCLVFREFILKGMR